MNLPNVPVSSLPFRCGIIVLFAMVCFTTRCYGLEIIGAPPIGGEGVREVAVSEGATAWLLKRENPSGVGGVMELPAGEYLLRFNFAADPRLPVIDPSVAVSVMAQGDPVAEKVLFPELGTPGLPGWQRAEIPFSIQTFPGAETATVFITFLGSGDFGVLSPDDGFAMIDAVRVLPVDSPDGLVLDSFGRRHTSSEELESIAFKSEGQTSWEAVSNRSWIHILNSGVGVGAGSVSYRVEANGIAERRRGHISVDGQNFSIVQEPGRSPKSVDARDQNLITNGSFEKADTGWVTDARIAELGDDALAGAFGIDLSEGRKMDQYVSLFPGRYRLEFAHAPQEGHAASHLDVFVVRASGKPDALVEASFTARAFGEWPRPVWQYESLDFQVERQGVDLFERVAIQFSRGVVWEATEPGVTPGIRFGLSDSRLDDVRLFRLGDDPSERGGIRIFGGTDPEIELTWPAPGEIQVMVSQDFKQWTPWLDPVASAGRTLTLSLPQMSREGNQFFSYEWHGFDTSQFPVLDADSGGAPLIWMEPGTLVMGSDASDPDRDNDEYPRTRVTLSRRFAMGAHEVTQAQYVEIMGENPSRIPGRDRHPVTNAEWFEAREFCRRLTDRERWAGRLPAGYEYRLPTEAEWSYACRAGSTQRFHYGDDPDYVELVQYAWFKDNSGGTTHPVGTKRPNQWGFYGMHGNVHEWCLDKYYFLPGGHVVDPDGPDVLRGDDWEHIIKGGSWSDEAKNCRTEDRHRDWFALDGGNVGFRVALAPVQGTLP